MTLCSFRAGFGLEHDSNIFRLPESAPVAERSDTITTGTAGIKITKPWGLQRFELDAELQDHRYSEHAFLDFTAFNYAAAWRWSLTPRLHGNFTGDRREYVDTSVDVQNTGQLNRRTERSTVLDGEYELDGVWRVLGGTFERKSTSNSALTFEPSTLVRSAEAGVRHVFSSGSSLSYKLKSATGEYPDRVPTPLLPESFQDSEHELRFTGALTGKTRLEARLAYFDRQHEGVGARDFSGVVGQAQLNWTVTGKTNVSAGIAREMGSYQTNTASYYVGNRIFVTPTWKPTEKTALRLRYDYGLRQYNGPLPGFAADGRRDRNHLGLVAFDWELFRNSTITAWLQHERRNSSAAGWDYRATMVGLSLLAKF